VLVLVAVPIIVLLTLPVAVLLPLANAPEALDQPRGTIWSGGASWTQPGHAPLKIDWRWRGGRRWNWRAEDSLTRLAGHWRPGRGIQLSDVQGEVALDRVDIEAWLPGSRPRGRLSVNLPAVVLVRGHSPRIEGRLVWENARLDGALHEELGRIEVRLSATPERQRASIRSLEPAPIQVDGQIEAGVRDYELALWLTPAPGRDDLARELSRLGPLDEQGRAHVQLRGALGW
jgi:hypothetical protein